MCDSRRHLLYQAFRIFHEIHFYGWETGHKLSIPYMIDQSHIDKSKIEAMIQTAVAAQEQTLILIQECCLRTVAQLTPSAPSVGN